MPHKNLEDHKENARKRQSKYYWKHRAKILQRNWDLKVRALEYLGGECKFCGYDDERALQFDHINNDGHKRRTKGGEWSGQFLHKRILDGTVSDIQVLCANCNWIKRHGALYETRDRRE